MNIPNKNLQPNRHNIEKKLNYVNNSNIKDVEIKTKGAKGKIDFEYYNYDYDRVLEILENKILLAQNKFEKNKSLKTAPNEYLKTIKDLINKFRTLYPCKDMYQLMNLKKNTKNCKTAKMNYYKKIKDILSVVTLFNAGKCLYHKGKNYRSISDIIWDYGKGNNGYAKEEYEGLVTFQVSFSVEKEMNEKYLSYSQNGGKKPVKKTSTKKTTTTKKPVKKTTTKKTTTKK